MKAVILAIVAFGTLVSVLARSSTGATFTDQAKSTGNTFTTATMAPPTGLSASLGADGETVTLNWTATTTAFATSYDVSRGTVSLTYAFLTNVSPATTITTTDMPAKPANSAVPSYYYALQSRYQNWASTYSNQASVKPLDHFAVTNTSGANIGNQTAGTPFSVKVTAQTADNLAISNFTGTVALAGSSGSGCTATPASQALVAGIATYSVTCTTAATGVSLAATYQPGLPSTQRTGTSNTFNVAAAAAVPTKYYFSGTSVGGPNACSSSSVLVLDSAKPANSGVNVDLGQTVTWVSAMPANSLGAGTYTFSFKRTTPNANTTTITVQLGYCTGGAFTQVGTTTVNIHDSSSESGTITLGAAVSLSGRSLAIRIANPSGTDQANITLRQDDSFFSGPVN